MPTCISNRGDGEGLSVTEKHPLERLQRPLFPSGIAVTYSMYTLLQCEYEKGLNRRLWYTTMRKLNEDKLEILVVGSKAKGEVLSTRPGYLNPWIKSEVASLGVILDSALNSHINKVTRAAFTSS